MTQKWIFTLSILLAFTGVGCQRVQEASTPNALNSSSELAANCKAATQAIAPDTINIEGISSSQLGQPVSYKLNQDISCSPTQKVSWRTLAGDSATSKGSQYVATFGKTGQYIVAAEINSAGSTTEMAKKTTVVSGSLALIGPQVAVTQSSLTFDLAVPQGMDIISANWNFGDGTPLQFGINPQTHSFSNAGVFQVTVYVGDSSDNLTTVTQSVLILNPIDGLDCLNDLAISGSNQAIVGQPILLSIYLPPCLTSHVSWVSWNFNDNSALQTGLSVQHTYSSPGVFDASIDVYFGESDIPAFTLKHSITVTAKIPDPTDPNACSQAGQTREHIGENYTLNENCGISGHRSSTYRDRIVETCHLNQNEALLWGETSRTRELVSEGICQGQSCQIPGGGLMVDGSSQTFYSSQNPEGSCSSVSQTRLCNNGVLGGSAAYIYSTCQNGCSGFGPNGTIRVGVVTGEAAVARVCQHGETGISDIFNLISDQLCSDGQVLTSNTRRGEIKTPGLCPTYSWQPTDKWTPCSSDCGGQQSRIYECRNNSEALSDNSRCSTVVPVQERICDGNPAAAARVETSVTSEALPTQLSCPANQIGVVKTVREVTLTKNFACIDHRVQLASESTHNGDWITEKYCRAYVAHRCSKDSLSNTQAHGRYQWMLKCRSQVQAIDEFLTQFDTVDQKVGKATFGIDSVGRILYPTFMNHGQNIDQPWIAPINPDASCAIPDTAYVASVCVSSCATPEQLILSKAEAKGKLGYTPFIEALTNDFDWVGTMKSGSSINSRSVQRTKVQQWITELVDTEQMILEFRMSSGGSLRLTPNHPLLTPQGEMREASEFKVGDRLVRFGGESDPIVAIHESMHFGKVYNLFVESAEPQMNVVITNGYLNGTAYFQNEGAKDMNRNLFRKRLIKGVFSK